MKTYNLRTGAKIVHNQFNAPYVTISFNVGAGMLDDSSIDKHDHIYSKAHLLEHIVALNIVNDTSAEKLISDKIVGFNAVVNSYFTRFEVKLEPEYITQVVPIVMDKVFNTVIDYELLKKEIEVIEIENVVTGLNYTSFPHRRSQIEGMDAEKISALSSLLVSEEMVSKKESIMNVDNLTAYYKEKYTPDSFVISISGGDENDCDFIKSTADKLFEQFPDATFKKIEGVQFIYPDEVLKKQEKYRVNHISGDKSDYANIKVSLPSTNKLKRKPFVADLYSYFLSYNNFTTFNSLLNKQIRGKRHAAYSERCYLSYENGETRLMFSIPTTSKYVNTNLKGIRNLLFKVANEKVINKEIFDKTKKSYIAYNKKLLIESAQSNNEGTVQSIFLDPKYKGIKSFNDSINEIRYDDFIDYAKFVNTTNDFLVHCTSNDVRIEDLKAFEPIKKRKENQNTAYAKDIDKKAINEMLKTKDFEINR